MKLTRSIVVTRDSAEVWSTPVKNNYTHLEHNITIPTPVIFEKRSNPEVVCRRKVLRFGFRTFRIELLQPQRVFPLEFFRFGLIIIIFFTRLVCRCWVFTNLKSH